MGHVASVLANGEIGHLQRRSGVVVLRAQSGERSAKVIRHRRLLLPRVCVESSTGRECRGGLHAEVIVVVLPFVGFCSRVLSTFATRLAMEFGDNVGRAKLTTIKKTAIAAVVMAMLFRCHQERALGGMRAQKEDVSLSKGWIPWPSPKLYSRRTDGAWEDLRQCDDTTEEYLGEKLRMSPRVFREIAEALPPRVQRRVGFYREPLQPDHIIAYALYRWALGEMYESSTCNFGIGRASELVAIRDVTTTLLKVYREKISWPTGVRKSVILRALTDKGFANCHRCIDCTHIYIDKLANAPNEDYYDRKRRFSIVAQVIVDLNLRVLDVHMGYPGNCHNVRAIQMSSLWARAEANNLFSGPPVMLPFQVQTNGYLLGDNYDYPPSEWIVVPYGGIGQHLVEECFDNKQKVARGVVERDFGRLKGMSQWRLFLRTHKTNMETLPQ
ncbi:hypothetical protein CBR_g38003 [Chara braunii]|uniref:DDE Tnp4 domain-containing protein n=1 Tax=Chara braunii TaxID=69332 RepID=A0A388LP74_CHABU|nr:hypothetical protein CBR_g38003 [Chara braunii]|eukprot:GBG84128.1 hypothetical protein CBR_g38003 [Chara braunii]